MRKSWWVAILTALVLVAGCAGFQEYNEKYGTTIQLTYKAGTYELLAAEPDATRRVIEITDSALGKIALGEIASTNALLVYLRQEIDYTKLRPSTALLLDELLNILKSESDNWVRDALPVATIQEALISRLSYVNSAAKQYQQVFM